MIISTKQIGHWDKAGRFYINDEYHTDSSKHVRRPSRNWPYSEWKHVHTKKYAKQLAQHLGVDSVEII